MEMKTPSSFILGLVLFLSFQFISSDRELDEQFGCYPRKDVIELKCQPDNRLALKEIIYGVPSENCTEENMEAACSRNTSYTPITDKFWSFMKNNQTQKCSGHHQCSFQTTWDQVASSNYMGDNITTSTCFLIVKGECIYEDHQVDFCQDKEISGPKIYIHNPGFPSFEKSVYDYECDCTVKSEDILNLYAILFTLDFAPKSNGSSSLQIYNDNDNVTLTRDDKMFRESINISDSNSINMKLTMLGHWKAHQMWLRITSTYDDKVTVKCEKRKYFGIHTTVNPEVIKVEADHQRFNDFWTVLEIVGGVIGGLIFITLIVISILTYRRYANIVKHQTLK